MVWDPPISPLDFTCEAAQEKNMLFLNFLFGTMPRYRGWWVRCRKNEPANLRGTKTQSSCPPEWQSLSAVRVGYMPRRTRVVLNTSRRDTILRQQICAFWRRPTGISKSCFRGKHAACKCKCIETEASVHNTSASAWQLVSILYLTHWSEGMGKRPLWHTVVIAREGLWKRVEIYVSESDIYAR